MSREKSIFEQMGGTYTEIDGILYPNILRRRANRNNAGCVFRKVRRFMEKVHERKPAGKILSSGSYRAVETKSGRSQ